MAISRTQPMRPAEIDILNHIDDAESDITALQNGIQELQGQFATIPVFEYGSSDENVIQASSNDVVSFTFANAKESAPCVVCSIECTEENEGPLSNGYGIITSISNVGFSIRIYNQDSANARRFIVNWIAIGE